MISNPKDINWKLIAFWLVVIIGLSARIYQFFLVRSLWEDEAHLALNIINKSYKELLGPLDYAQSAPVLFLLSVKAFTTIFGYAEWALRLFPFLISIFSLPFFYYLLLNLTRKKLIALIGLLFFGINLSLIYYSNELKPYTIDVACYVILSFLTFSSDDYLRDKRNIWLAFSGSLAILYSNVAIIILSSIAAFFIFRWLLNKRVERGQMLILMLWSVVFGINYYLFISKYPHTEEIRAEWAFTYMPLNLLSCDFINFLNRTIDTTFFSLLLYFSEKKGAGWVLFIFLFTGVYQIIRQKNYGLLFLTAGPVFIHLVISGLQLYPFYYRFILYLVPIFITISAIGIHTIFDFLNQKIHLVSGIAFLIMSFWLFTESSISRFPLWDREIKPSLSFINNRYSQSTLLITTPHTLYKYYYQTGIANNANYRFIGWEMTPEQFYNEVADVQNDFILLHAADSLVDGYGAIMEDLKEKQLVLNEFSYKSYTVTVIKSSNRGGMKYTYKDFDPKATFELNEERVVANWGGTVYSKPWTVSRGNYDVIILSKGTPALGIQPRLQVKANNNLLGSYSASENYSVQHFHLSKLDDAPLQFAIIMENDTVSNGEDRNAFIRTVALVPKK